MLTSKNKLIHEKKFDMKLRRSNKGTVDSTNINTTTIPSAITTATTTYANQVYKNSCFKAIKRLYFLQTTHHLESYRQLF